ncbi:MFS transporter [Streptomyces sp. 549]|uniref:MDR family MFS transporter n=1 Tax=Streptomyces sp. 549 TaxID=3049076 RepID=UPI0024C262EC|nr:MFS transporter [Streptomyces sp. 549]MDK1472031.1 MFS transporter [Streptomyces sp. 549]
MTASPHRTTGRPAGKADEPSRAGKAGRLAAARTGRATWRRLPPLLRLLIATQLAFNIGFFLVLPYLAAYLGGTLGMTGALVGLVLGLRTFSQQGLFVVGGALTDRVGVRPVVLTGCVLRIAGFVWLGWAEQTWTVVGAVLLIGFAAALFSPAVESEIARQAVCWEQDGGGPRTGVLALFTVAGQAGAFLGPLLGALLLTVDFRAVCLAGAAVFVAVLAGHVVLLPQHIPGRHPVRGRGALRALLRNRPFLALCGAYSAYLLAYNQLYLALPAEIDRTAHPQVALAYLFALSSLLVVTVQLPLTRWASDRWGLRRSMTAGLLTIACGFAVVAASQGWSPGGPVGLLPAAAFVVLLTVGQMLLVPAARAWLPDLAQEGRLGLYTGALSSLSGLVVLGGSAAAGALLDALPPAVAWAALAAVPLVALALVPRREPPPR